MSQLTFLADVSSNEETSESNKEVEDNNSKDTKNTRGPNKDYKFGEICLTKEIAEEILKKETIWSYYRTRPSRAGEKLIYRCNKVAYREKNQCASGVYILLHANNVQCSIYRTYCKSQIYFFFNFLYKK
jgi:hypothetical protein